MKLARITPKIYAFTIVLTLLVGVGTVLTFYVWFRFHPMDAQERVATHLAKEIAHAEPASLEAAAAELAKDVRAKVLLVGDAPRTLADTIGEPCRERRERQVGCATGSAPMPDARSRIEVTILTGSAPPLAYLLILDFVVLAFGALVLGRAFTRPLRTIAETADAFGRGDVRARNRIVRADEIGDVGRAFDQMAERITDLIRIERELLANISHELRTPLTRIRLALELAATGNADGIRNAYADIVEDLDELEELISGVLASARVELEEARERKGISPLRLEQLALHDVVARAAARFQRNHPERRLEIADVAADVLVDADPIQLRRAIENLLGNAHKYTDDADSPIDIEVETTPSLARLRVVDRGVGIPEADREHVFTPFFRGRQKTEGRATGLGLGLVLVRRIVEAHGGEVHLTSREGAGTVVTIELPRS